MKQPSIDDVAKRAGVSTATVSHVLNGTRVVSQHTRSRVMAAARDLTYNPSAIARSLKTKTTGTIGVVLSDVRNPFSTAVLRGIEDVTSKEGRNVILCNSDESEEKAETYLRVLLAKRIDGLILASPGHVSDSLDTFLAMGIPVVLIDRLVSGRSLPFVGINNVEGARQAVQHLLDDGHRRIGVITGLERVSTSVERLRGYESALRGGGLEIDPVLVKKGYSSVDGGGEATRELLMLSHPPTAIFTSNNFMTLGAIKTFRELGVGCPDQIALFGFDDHEWAVIFSPPVSVVRQPTYELGTTAAEMLLHAIRGGNHAASPVLLDTTLVIRQSCKPGGHAHIPQVSADPRVQAAKGTSNA